MTFEVTSFYEKIASSRNIHQKIYPDWFIDEYARIELAKIAESWSFLDL